MARIDRRVALGRGLTLGLGGLLWGARGARGSAANRRFRVGVIGLGGMGNAHLSQLAALGARVEVVALCDVDAGRLAAAAQRVPGATAYRNHEELLLHPDLDLVCLATPDHQHARGCLHACQAGCDVYVEKPLAHSVAEGRAMVETARRYGRVVQMGTMQRSQPHFRRVVEIVRNGLLGEVRAARCWFGAAPAGAWTADPAIPPELDWDAWLGPAPWVPYNPHRVHGSWRYFWDYGGGLMTDWGVHLLDIVHWALNDDIPHTIEARGEYAPGGYNDCPVRMEARFEYPSYTLTWNQGSPERFDPERRDYGILFYGSEADLFCDRSGYDLYPKREGGQIRALTGRDWRLPEAIGHWQDFLAAVEARSEPVCDVAVGHRSTVAPILGNIALRTGRVLRWDGAREQFVGDAGADRYLSRPARRP